METAFLSVRPRKSTNAPIGDLNAAEPAGNANRIPNYHNRRKWKGTPLKFNKRVGAATATAGIISAVLAGQNVSQQQARASARLAAQNAARAQAPAASILVQGGTVVDGTGAKPRRTDVRIIGDTITEVGKLTPIPGERRIDARGLTVAPGFIDTHSHGDGGLLDKPEAEAIIRQGVTTIIVGQDGGSHFPLASYFDSLAEKRVGINVASFVGHGTIRNEVTGKDYKRKVTSDELAKMQALVAQEMDAGGLGLSTGLEYDPGFYSTTEELIALSQVAGQKGGMYISHVRDEGNQAFESFRELIRIGTEGHLPAQISHIKLDTSPSWGRAKEAVQLINDANKQGQDITADVYPYTYWQSTMIVLIPSRDWDDRALWEKGLAEVGGAAHVLLSTYTPDASWAGKTIAEISQKTGRDAVSIIQEIVHKTHDPGTKASEGVVVTAMTESDLKTFLTAPRIMFCSDGVPGGRHPRGAGTYPRILGRYVREKHYLSLPEAVRKMTSLPAWRMGLRDRGKIAPGMKADLAIFNAKTVLDRATTADPTAPPIGIESVLVNGVVELEGEKLTGERAGTPLRRQQTVGHRVP